MTTASTIANIPSFYKRLYSGKKPGEIASINKPFLEMLRTEDGFKGYDSAGTFAYAINYGNPQGISGTFSTAQTNAGSVQAKQFRADRKKMFGVITVDGEAIAASEGDDGAFWSALKKNTDGVLDAMGEELEFQLLRDGSGVRGRRASASGNVITLTVASDVRNFRIGMYVTADDTYAGTSLRVGSTYVTAVDPDAGTVTLYNAAGITTFLDNDYLFRMGMETTAYNLTGLAAHLPLVAPVLGSDSFRGVDRGVDTRRLAGVRINDTGSSIEENAGNAIVKIGEVGKKADTLLLSPRNLWNVVKRRQSQVVYQGAGGEVKYGFNKAIIETPSGTITAISSPLMSETLGYVLTKSTWYLKSLKAMPHIIMDDGIRSLRQTSDDGVEIRCRSMGDLICTEPGANAVFAVAS